MRRSLTRRSTTLVDRHGSAVVAGGTGLYLRAALDDLRIPEDVEPFVRRDAEALYDANREAAHARLEQLDPAAAKLVHVNDRRRVVRALELATVGASLAPSTDRLWSAATRRPTARGGPRRPSRGARPADRRSAPTR